ncbi:helix-turn-helix transcriptional regulator [Singulisphaera sp. PoT]|uniref:helix-turn-helix transcriptional regulator n=1 Tax=Singulisphaera sp. PoT TaxID=3411797 RepID=UPI003BF4E8FC
METLQKKIEKAGGIRKAAMLIGISPSYLSDLMNGKRGISVEFASKAQAAMGVGALDLLKWQATDDWERFEERRKSKGTQS